MPLDPTPVPPELRGLRIGLLVSGGVAAYKIVDLASALTQAGCEVRVAMTQAATRFVGPPSFEGVTGHPVVTGVWPARDEPEPHVFLGDWAQLILVAPATADVIGRIAAGRADDIVTATLLAARCPVVVAPAMNDAMWAKTAVKDNLAVVLHLGMVIVEPEAGHLASGHVGTGRLAAPATLLNLMASAVRARYDLSGRRVLVTAGGTREPIDPVRFLGNRSSGKMGLALANAAADRGASVTLISTVELAARRGVKVEPVESAADMLEHLRAASAEADLLLMAAAVADFRPEVAATSKIRREDSTSLTLKLTAIPDLVAALAQGQHADRLYRVGFAAEDSGLDAKAVQKLKKKRLHAIVANDISRPDIGFGSDYNEAVMLFDDGERHELPRMTKREMADRILDLVLPRLHPKD